MLKYEFPRLYKMKCELMALYCESSVRQDDWIDDFRLRVQQFLFTINNL
jgi:hypothetical protein